MINLKYKDALHIFLCFLYFIEFGMAETLFVGDSCIHENSKLPGICSLLNSCPSALEDLTKRILPQTCGFVGTSPIVCCRSTLTPKPVGAKSIEKCKEYAKSVYKIVPSPRLIGGPQQNITINTCATRSLKLIVGGTKAISKEFPHMAQVGYDVGDGSRIFVCGGSLISEIFVLTAGHCLSTEKYGLAKYVRLGDLDISTESDDADVQIIIVENIIKYPDYKPPSQYHDIGLLRLQKDAIFTPYVRPICLNTRYDFEAEKAVASGWGNTAYLGTNSDHLLKVTLDLYNTEECSKGYELNNRHLKKGILDHTQLCAGSKNERKDTCQGDSGGPLQKYHEKLFCSYSLLGVTSFGKPCGIVVNIPGVYTRVSYYIDWIENIVWP